LDRIAGNGRFRPFLFVVEIFRKMLHNIDLMTDKTATGRITE